MAKQARSLMAGLVTLSLLVAACGGDVTTTPTVPATDGSSPGAERPTGGTVTVALHTFGVESLDPALGTNEDMTYWGPMFDWLIGVGPDGLPSSDTGALTDWQSSEDGTQWTFTMREGMEWQDGEAVTADDAKFSFERYAMDDSICTFCSHLKATMESVEVTGTYTFTVNLTEPNYLFTNILTPTGGEFALLPEHHWNGVGGPEGFNQEPLGSGPWKFVEREIGQYVEYEANPDYWNAAARPQFDRLRLTLTPEVSSRLAQVETGEVDLAPMTPDVVPQIEDAGLRVMGPEDVQVMWSVFYRSWDPEYPSSDERVRQAVNLAIDREGLVEAVYPGGAGEPSASTWAPLHVGYDPDIEPYPYDPEEARRLLQEAGKEGLEVLLYQYSFAIAPEIPRIQEVIAGYLNQAGFNARLEPVDFATIRPGFIHLEGARLAEPDGPMVLMILLWTSAASIDFNMRMHTISKTAGGNSETFWDRDYADQMFNEYVSTPSEEDRERIANEMNHYIHDTYGTTPLALTDQVWAAGDRIADWRPTPGSPFDLNYETLTPTN